MSNVLENPIEAIVPIELGRDERDINWYSRVTQFFSWPVIFLVFHFFFRLRIAGRANLKKISSPFLVISNHISFYDSFLFRLAFGFITPHLPLRFMAVKKFNWPFLNLLARIGIIDLIYEIFGVFIIVPGKGVKENLKIPIQILRDGGNVVIFPEGRISTDQLSPFKRGAALLAKITHVPVLPISFKLVDKEKFRPTIIINIGDPIVVIDSVEKTTLLFREVIEDLIRH
jgi:1-acyl-sn-glycerol-3-phosphate acyltransferase